MTDISTYKLDAAFTSLAEFDHCAKPNDFIEVSLWHNGEGFDAHLSSHSEQSFKLTWGEFKALKKLIKELDND
jgi:quinol monooxygenase YgiN